MTRAARELGFWALTFTPRPSPFLLLVLAWPPRRRTPLSPPFPPMLLPCERCSSCYPRFLFPFLALVWGICVDRFFFVLMFWSEWSRWNGSVFFFVLIECVKFCFWIERNGLGFWRLKYWEKMNFDGRSKGCFVLLGLIDALLDWILSIMPLVWAYVTWVMFKDQNRQLKGMVSIRSPYFVCVRKSFFFSSEFSYRSFIFHPFLMMIQSVMHLMLHKKLVQ